MAITKEYIENNASLNWRELKEYLVLFVEAEVDRWMLDPDNTYSEQYARINTVENLHESIEIIFGDILDQKKKTSMYETMDRWA